MNAARKPSRLDVLSALACLAALFGSACASQGHAKIRPDQFNYNQAIGEASSEQMLLNLIRLRYRAVPVFLVVNSVLTQYIYSTNVGLSGSIGELQAEDANSLTANTGLRYLERPTITYSPLSGEKFAEQLMTPIPGELMFSLMQSGWPAADMMMMGMERIGERRNPLFPHLATEAGKKLRREFREAVDLVLEVARRDSMEMQAVEEGDSLESYLVFERSTDPETAELIDACKQELGLAPDLWRFRMVNKVLGREEGEITIRVRSLLDLMGYLSGGVEVPTLHRDRHIDEPTSEIERAGELVPLRVQSGPERPADVFLSVKYLGQWFWIDPRDERSKESFGLLTYLFLMMAPAPEGGGPLLTVPAG